MNNAYILAKEQFAALGVDTEAAIKALSDTPISLHCWQGDDVTGFLLDDAALSGGIQTTGNYPGRARNAAELRADLEKAMSLIPGPLRLNLHAIYADTDRKVDLDGLETRDFATWIDWAKERKTGLDFNPTCFSHPMAASGFTVSSADDNIRNFWIRHCKACRTIAADMGKALGTPCVTNFWFPDGYKDIPVDREAPRRRMMEALDEIFSTPADPRYELNAFESKVFGIGVESYTVGSNEFVTGYAISRGILPTLDAGHFHPTEVISDKISSLLLFCPELLLHVSRPVRWDSDHVVIFDDELQAIASALVRNDLLKRTHIGLDYFDASINRIAAWVIGTRNMQKALLRALLEPAKQWMALELNGDYTARLALTEAFKTLPFGAVWQEYCDRQGVPGEHAWLDDVRQYEKDVLSKR